MKKNHMPLLGYGPLYVIIILAVTLIGLYLSVKRIIPYVSIPSLKYPFIIVGTVLILLGVYLWVQAVIISKLDRNILDNKLVTTGVYAYVRNPVYSGFATIFTGVLLIYGNLYLLILPIFYWWFMTQLMKSTEEKWLVETFGDEYIQYAERVNRVIPWFPKKR